MKLLRARLRVVPLLALLIPVGMLLIPAAMRTVPWNEGRGDARSQTLGWSGRFASAMMASGCDNGCGAVSCMGDSGVCAVIDAVTGRADALKHLADVIGKITKGDGTCKEYCSMHIQFVDAELGAFPGTVCPCTNTPQNQPGVLLNSMVGGQRHTVYSASFPVDPNGGTGRLPFKECIPAGNVNIDGTSSAPWGLLLVKTNHCPDGQCERYLPLFNASLVMSIDKSVCGIDLIVKCQPLGLCVPCE
jgi:hypothetical protein